MKQRFLKYFSLGIVLTTVLISSCTKDDFVSDDTILDDKGTTYFKVLEGSEVKLFFSPFTDVKQVPMFSIRKENPSNQSLQTPASIKIEQNAGIITKYNADHSETFEELPSSFYAFTGDAGYVKTSNGYTVNFAAGVFSQNFKLNIDGSKWIDLSKKYALAFRVTDWGGIKKTAATSDTIVVLLSIKNKWDGVYAVTGSMVDVLGPANSHVNNGLGADAPMQYELRTISPTKCAAYDNYVIGGVWCPFYTGTGLSYYGTFGLVFEFDPVTDKVVSVTNYYGTVANTRAGRLDPSGSKNSYDASTKTLTVKYNMLQPSLVPVAPNVRVTWDEVWKYIASRE
ncbi:DUF1735 domain-containing protein [Pedobacter frigidisoli]|uniref:DUF1735 domain-containing protein n=1 Tax=Pedobacter frigidisoli TaxID=2530455 RepID=A0A4R0NHG3_9SPHI|nr:DUF1735 domain-containing protein [Pedobacter frigidisoli]TCD00031.1 DUF1735 domain-containing protein [Pedobacter frigidisoli]